jgi:hypothetical protein
VKKWKFLSCNEGYDGIRLFFECASSGDRDEWYLSYDERSSLSEAPEILSIEECIDLVIDSRLDLLIEFVVQHAI